MTNRISNYTRSQDSMVTALETLERQESGRVTDIRFRLKETTTYLKEVRRALRAARQGVSVEIPKKRGE